MTCVNVVSILAFAMSSSVTVSWVFVIIHFAHIFIQVIIIYTNIHTPGHSLRISRFVNTFPYSSHHITLFLDSSTHHLPSFHLPRPRSKLPRNINHTRRRHKMRHAPQRRHIQHIRRIIHHGLRQHMQTQQIQQILIRRSKHLRKCCRERETGEHFHRVVVCAS